MGNASACPFLIMGPKVQEALYILAEECAEVIQAISKINRFGCDNVNPSTNKTNLKHLENEIGDLMAMIEILRDDLHILSDNQITTNKLLKFEKLKHFSNLYK